MSQTFYISPTGSGTKDGSSWENAGTIGNLSAFVAGAGPGGEVLIRADQGAYQLATQVTLTAGGDAGAPVTVRGVDGTGNPMKAQIAGIGAFEAFRLLTGANHLTFEDMSFDNFAGSAFRLGSDLQDLTIAGIDASNVTRFVQNDAFGDNITATVSGLTIRDSSVAGYTLGAISLKYDTHDVLIENFVGDGQNHTGEQYVRGVHLNGTVHDVVIRKVTMMNNYGHTSDGEYWNGDGFTTERGVYNVRFEDTVAKNNTDGGYDIKSSNTVLVRALAEGNTENYRFWTNPASVEGLTSIDATYYGGTGRATHIWLADNAQAMIAGGTITEPDPIESIFDIGTGAELIVQGAIIVKTGDTPFKSGNGILTGLSEWPPTTQAINGTNKGDALTGTSANDLINGKSGDDKILAKDGSDVLIGDAGKDAFIFDTKLGSANVDIIVDFNTADDTIRIDDKMFTKLKTGQLPSSAFVIGEKALDSDDRIIYNDKTGALYHDPDGTGSAAAVKFAVIENLAKLSAASFVVF